MLDQTVTIVNPLGLHARASARLVRLLEDYDATVTVQRLSDGQRANARDILELLQLAANRGTEIRVETEGNDAAIALQAVTELFRTGFGENSTLDDQRFA